MENHEEIKRRLKAHQIPYWKLGDVIGVSEVTIVRWLRKPMSNDKFDSLALAIEKLKGSDSNE